MHYRVTDSRGHQVRRGDTVTDFRGDTATFAGVSRGPLENREAKVYCSDRLGESYASVYGLTVEVN